MNINPLVILVIIALALSSCQSEYEQFVEQELGSGIINDSLIFNMRMGQTKKDFFSACWELNRQKLISNGSGNSMARHITDLDTMGKTTPWSKNMSFYGIFDDQDTMRGMDLVYYFMDWSPWVKNRQSDTLLVHLLDLYERGYPGNDFIEIEIKETNVPAFVKIDGNRQILMYPKGDKDVVVKIEDLHYKLNKEWKKE